MSLKNGMLKLWLLAKETVYPVLKESSRTALVAVLEAILRRVK